MSRSTDTIPTAPPRTDRARDELIDFIAAPPADTSSGDGHDPLTLGWFNGSRTTVAVPLHNARADIERIIDDIITFARAVPSWDFLFIDDGSTDQTLAAFNRRVAAINFVDPGMASRLAIIPSAPHAGLGHTTRIAGLECDCEHLIVLLPSFRGDWPLISRLRDALQSQHMILAEAIAQGPWALRLVRRVVARVLGAHAAVATPPQAIALRGPEARQLAERTAIRSHGFDIELGAIAARLGWRCGAITAEDQTPTTPSRHTLASTLETHWLGHIGVTCLAAVGTAARLALGVYRLGPLAETSRVGRERGVFRRKAS